MNATLPILQPPATCRRYAVTPDESIRWPSDLPELSRDYRLVYAKAALEAAAIDWLGTLDCPVTPLYEQVAQQEIIGNFSDAQLTVARIKAFEVAEEFADFCNAANRPDEIGHLTAWSESVKTWSMDSLTMTEPPTPFDCLAPRQYDGLCEARKQADERQKKEQEQMDRAEEVMPPGIIGEIVQYNLSVAKRLQPELALAGAIALVGAVVGRKVRDEFGTRSNIQIIGLAPTGRGKDAARQVNVDVLTQAAVGHLRGADELLAPEEVASDAGLFRMLHEWEARLWQLDEFGRFLATTTSAKNNPHLFAVPSALMRLFTSAGKLFRPKAYGDTKQNIEINQPCLVLHATSTPDALYSALSADTVADGFLGRCLIFIGDDKPARQMVPITPVPESIVKFVREWFHKDAYEGPREKRRPNPQVVHTIPEATRIFNWLANMAEEQIDQGGTRAALWARTEEKARQLALIYACSLTTDCPVIDQDAARWACRLAARLTGQMVKEADGRIASNAQEAMQQKLLRVIAAHEAGISGTELCRSTRWLKRRDREELLRELFDSGLIVGTPEMTKGRPSMRWKSTQEKRR